MDVMKKDCIKLPVDNNGCPDWSYMDSYMANVIKDSSDFLSNFMVV